MRDCLVLALWIAVASAANCVGENPCRPVSPNAVDSPASISNANSIGEQYVLRMEEVSGPPPRIEHVVGAPNVGTGWLDVANGAFEKIQIGKSIELLVSTTSQFHLTFRDRGDTVELDGMLQKIPIVPAKQAATDAYRAVSYMAVTPTQGLIVETAMRAQHFNVPCSEVLEAIAEHQMFDEFSKLVTNERSAVDLDEICDRLRWYGSTCKMLALGVSTQSERLLAATPQIGNAK